MECEKILSVDEAAKMFNISSTWVTTLIRRGVIPAKQVGGTYAMHQDDLSKISWKRKPGREKKTIISSCLLCGKETLPKEQFCKDCR